MLCHFLIERSIGKLRGKEVRFSVRHDFRCRADAFRGVSDEPSPPLARRCEVSFNSTEERRLRAPHRVATPS